MNRSPHRVVWSEGMFLQQHHFQQQDRYLQAQMAEGLRAIRPHGFGFTALAIDPAQLAMGKVLLTECAGILPDGTRFSVCGEAGAMPCFSVAEGAQDVSLVLALPASSQTGAEFASSPLDSSLERHQIVEIEVADSNAHGGDVATLQLGRLNLRLLSEDEAANSHTYLGVTKIIERDIYGHVQLDQRFVPPLLAYRQSAWLAGVLDDFVGRLCQRGQMLAAHLGAPGLGGAMEVQQYLMLQIVNRAQALFTHLVGQPSVHPEVLYRELVALSGELAVFVRDSKRPAIYPPYRQDRLAETFAPLVDDLQQALSHMTRSAAISLPIEEREFGIRFAPVADQGLYDGARFILAVQAQMPDGEFRRMVPANLKVGSAEHIRHLVDLQLPGLSMHVLPTAPRELPYYPGFTYVELKSAAPFQQAFLGSAGFGLHVAGDLPGLRLALWAIRDAP